MPATPSLKEKDRALKQSHEGSWETWDSTTRAIFTRWLQQKDATERDVVNLAHRAAQLPKKLFVAWAAQDTERIEVFLRIFFRSELKACKDPLSVLFEPINDPQITICHYDEVQKCLTEVRDSLAIINTPRSFAFINTFCKNANQNGWQQERITELQEFQKQLAKQFIQHKATNHCAKGSR